MADLTASEARLRRSLDTLRREIANVVEDTNGGARAKDTFEGTFRNAMTMLRKLLGFDRARGS